MQVQLVSDLHLDFYLHSWRDVVKHISQRQDDLVEALIIAGDLAEAHNGIWTDALKWFADHYPNVIIVLGNHDHYQIKRSDVDRIIDQLPTNVYHLDCSEITLFSGDQSIRIAGCTLWFDYSLKSIGYENLIADFSQIPDFKQWVNQQHQRDVNYLKHCNADCIVTHHAPHRQSTHPAYKNSALNQFFINDLEDLIFKNKPSYWLHGHTHHPFNYVVDQTRILANPLAYPKERYASYRQYPAVYVDLHSRSSGSNALMHPHSLMS